MTHLYAFSVRRLPFFLLPSVFLLVYFTTGGVSGKCSGKGESNRGTRPSHWQFVKQRTWSLMVSSSSPALS